MDRPTTQSVERPLRRETSFRETSPRGFGLSTPGLPTMLCKEILLARTLEARRKLAIVTASRSRQALRTIQSAARQPVPGMSSQENGVGVAVNGGSGTSLAGNFIGPDATGTLAMGNSSGVSI